MVKKRHKKKSSFRKKPAFVKRLLKWVIVLGIIALIVFGSYFYVLKWWRKESQIEARVGNDIITTFEVIARLKTFMNPDDIFNPKFGETVKYFKKQTLEDIIGDSLVMEYAKKRGYKITDEDLKDESLKNLASLDKVRKAYANLIEKDLEKESEKNLTDEELKKYFEENKSEFVKLKAQMIFIKKNEDKEKWDEQKKKIDEAYRKIKEGVPFSEVVKEYSDEKQNDGVLDYFDIFKFNALINEKIFDMKVGEISEPIETLDGFYIFKILDKLDNFQSVREEVKKRYIETTAERKLAELKEKLKKENEDKISYGNKVRRLIEWYSRVVLGRGGY